MCLKKIMLNVTDRLNWSTLLTPICACLLHHEGMSTKNPPFNQSTKGVGIIFSF